jgi:hypothetical protein
LLRGAHANLSTSCITEYRDIKLFFTKPSVIVQQRDPCSRPRARVEATSPPIGCRTSLHQWPHAEGRAQARCLQNMIQLFPPRVRASVLRGRFAVPAMSWPRTPLKFVPSPWPARRQRRRARRARQRPGLRSRRYGEAFVEGAAAPAGARMGSSAEPAKYPRRDFRQLLSYSSKSPSRSVPEKFAFAGRKLAMATGSGVDRAVTSSGCAKLTRELGSRKVAQKSS